jgi:hypothetical protein
MRSILRTSILGLFLGPLVVWPKVGEHTELLPTYLQSYVAHAYVLNSDEGLTERAQVLLITIVTAMRIFCFFV